MPSPSQSQSPARTPATPRLQTAQVLADLSDLLLAVSLLLLLLSLHKY